MKIKGKENHNFYEIHPLEIYEKECIINTNEGYKTVVLKRKWYGTFIENGYICFKVDLKHPSLFEITQVTKNGKNYIASRYHIKYIHYVLEKCYELARLTNN